MPRSQKKPGNRKRQNKVLIYVKEGPACCWPFFAHGCAYAAEGRTRIVPDNPFAFPPSLAVTPESGELADKACNTRQHIGYSIYLSVLS